MGTGERNGLSDDCIKQKTAEQQIENAVLRFLFWV